MTQDTEARIEGDPETSETIAMADDSVGPDSDEDAVSYSEIVGKPVSGKIVVLTIAAIVVGVVIIAKIWLTPAQQKLNAVYRKQKRFDACMADLKSNTSITFADKEKRCKRHALQRARGPKITVIPTKTPSATPQKSANQ